MAGKEKSITLAQYSLEEIIPLLGAGMPKITLATKSDIFSVKAATTRLQCFKNNQSCVQCGKSGSFFTLDCMAIDQHSSGQTCPGEGCQECKVEEPHLFITKNPHLNLYHLNESGMRILMTQDHRIPKSRGGSDKIDNLQTMCVVCNNKKDNKLESELTL